MNKDDNFYIKELQPIREFCLHSDKEDVYKYIYSLQQENQQLQQKVNHLELDVDSYKSKYKGANELYLDICKEVRQLEANRDEAINYIKNDMPYLQEVDKEYENVNGEIYFTYKEYDGSALLSILERGKE